MSPTKTWKRWVEHTKEFPKPKYGFSTHLRKVGDYVQTGLISHEDGERLKDAAKFWAYYHKKVVRIEKFNMGVNGCKMRVTLISNHRVREFL